MTTVAELAAVLTAQSQVIDDLDHAVTDLRAAMDDLAAAGPAGKGRPLAPVHADVPGFVEAIIAPLYAQHPPAAGWCPRWWEHREARFRLEAMWRSWELLRLEPALGMATWLRDIADVQMARLRDPNFGPFRACANGKHLVPPELPLVAVPAGEWERLTGIRPSLGTT